MVHPYMNKGDFALGYLPHVSWWMNWIANGMPEMDGDIMFDKRLRLNRCTIDSPNGPLVLTVPIQQMGNKALPLRSVRISEHGDWRHKHWHALESSYYKSPYFDYYQDDFRRIYEGNQELLMDFNTDLFRLVVDLLDLRNVSIYCDAGQPLSEYYQVFSYKHGFITDLSIVDLLFNMGPESLITFNNRFKL